MSSQKPYIIMLDNIDSFTYNLVDELRQLGYPMDIYRNTVPLDDILAHIAKRQQQGPVLLLLSPGPGAPHEAGCMMDLLTAIDGQVPVLGICLGHQAIVAHQGGQVARAPLVMHGKPSPVTHNHHPVFAGLSNPLPVARYHSLAATQLSEQLTVIADTDGIPMAVEAKQSKMLGFQFHPESVLTTHGSQLLQSAVTYLLEA